MEEDSSGKFEKLTGRLGALRGKIRRRWKVTGELGFKLRLALVGLPNAWKG